MFKKVCKIAIGIIALILIAIPLSIFGGAIMNLFGFEFTSIKSVVIFFILIGIIGFPLEIFAIVFPRALVSFNRIDIRTAKIMVFILDTLFSLISISLVDYYMDSVRASELSVFIISLLMAIASTKDIADEENRNTL